MSDYTRPNEFEAIILDSEGVQIVGPTVYEGNPANGLRVAVPPRPFASAFRDDIDLDSPLGILVVRAECERRRADGVYIFRRVEDFR